MSDHREVPEVNISKSWGEQGPRLSAPMDNSPPEMSQTIVAGDMVENSGGMSDVQAGIEFVYNIREHVLDIGVATVYFIAVYAMVLWIQKKLK